MSEQWWRRAAGPLRPWLRAIRHYRHRQQLEALIDAFDPASDGSAVSYLTRDFPAAPDEDGARSFGGAVKMAYLQRRFPHDARRPNLLYAVSSVAHPLADAIARRARRRG